MTIENGFEIIQCLKFSAIKYAANYWFTQKTISQITKTTVATINAHIVEIFKFKSSNKECLVFPISRIEGSRQITRKCKHYSLATFYDICLRSRRFDEINCVMAEINQKSGISLDIRVSPVKERNFKVILEKSLHGVEEFFCQYVISPYRVDFFFPRLGLIVEFDEDFHKKSIVIDKVRQSSIEKETGYKFIRVREGMELEGLNSILLFRDSIRII